MAEHRRAVVAATVLVIVGLVSGCTSPAPSDVASPTVPETTSPAPSPSPTTEPTGSDGHDSLRPTESAVPGESHFAATIVEVVVGPRGTRATVDPKPGGDMPESCGSPISMTVTPDSTSYLFAGELSFAGYDVDVYWDGTIMESFPCQIGPARVVMTDESLLEHGAALQ